MDNVEIIIQEVIENVTIVISDGSEGIPGAPGADGKTPDIKGNWDIGTQYVFFDAVYWTSIFGGGEGTPSGLWLANVPEPTLGAEPGEIIGEWELIAQNGYQGIEGIQGEDAVLPDPFILPNIKAGDDVNNVELSATGIKFNGTATVFDDVRFDSLSLQQSGSGVSLSLPECTVAYLSSANNLDYMIAAPQMPHGRKNGAVIHPHIHFEQAQNAVPNFALQYRYQLTLSPKTTAWTAVKCNTLATAYTSGTINQICYVDGGITPPATDDVSDIIQFRIIRDTTNALGLAYGADPYTGTVQVNSFDCHIELDGIGSANEYQKV